MDVSVVIPAYNEESRLGASLDAVVSYLQKRSFDFEILVVDDGSTDCTASIVLRQSDPRIFLLSYGKNRGKGFAVRTGVLAAKKSLILFSDADLSTPIEEFDGFLRSKADIVIGSRNLESSRITKKQPLIRQRLGRAFPRVVDAILPLGIKDTQCGFKLFKAKAAKRIFRSVRTAGFGFDVEALYLAKKMGYVIDEQPVEWRNAGGSKVSILRDVPRMLWDVFKVRWRDLCGQYG
ncbi:glycosyltransferase family 2 protein [Candidatus Woesearchaeota archaeon]|nr:glycosyltransferase family 2 protein [Candidatus Woesearchaeota archaeon]